MDREQFAEYVRQGMEHLYDSSYLETHPLASTPLVSGSGDARGRALRHVLIEAIQALKPGTDQPYASLAWRKYRYLYLRYVEDQPVPDIAADLGISVRQSRRYCQEALAAVTRILWDQWHESHGRRGSNRTVRDQKIDQEDVAIDQEVGRVEAGEPTARIPIGELLMGVISTIRPLAERRGAAVRASLPENLPAAVVDRTVLRQALLSVLVVSLDLGSTDVELSAKAGRDSDVVQVQVQADFPEAAATTSRRLVTDERWQIAQQLLHLQGVPLDLAVAGERTVSVTLGLPSAPDTTVLIVEDSADAVQLYRRYLSGSPYQMSTASSTRVLESVVREQPAVIVLDVMMPAQDGWEVLQLLKYHPYTRAIPVIVCSVLKERDLALALGAADALVKPIGRSAFLQALERLAPSLPRARQGSRGGSP